MSQEKVDRYKEAKANRKQIMRKEKIKHIVRKCAVCVVGLALLGWLGYSAYGVYADGVERPAVSVNYGAVDDYLGEIAAE